MSVVLSILQILGWILLIAFLIVLIVLGIILFCPVHYLVEGEWLDEKWARFKAHWFLHLFRVKISYGDDLIYGQVNLLWKKITFSFDLTAKKDEVEEELEDAVVDDVEDVTEDVEEAEDEVVTESTEKVIGTETASELRGETSSESKEETENETILETESDMEDEGAISDEEILTEEKKESIVSKIKGIINRIKEVYAKIKKILTDEKNQDAVIHLKNEVVYLIKILLPKKSKIDAVFSTGAPDTTGQLFGILACFPAMYQKGWKLAPDFEADVPYFRGTFWGKGWIAVYQLVGIILRIIFDKNCRRLYTIIKRFINEMKKDDKSQEEK